MLVRRCWSLPAGRSNAAVSASWISPAHKIAAQGDPCALVAASMPQLPPYLPPPHIRSFRHVIRIFRTRQVPPESISVSRGTFQPRRRSIMVAAVRAGLLSQRITGLLRPRQVALGRSVAVTSTVNPRTNTPRKRALCVPGAPTERDLHEHISGLPCRRRVEQGR